jgi:hypothetical protein
MSLLEELIRELKEKPHLARKLAEKLNATLSTEILSSIEIHMLGNEERMLKKGDSFELHYLLIVGDEPNTSSWMR